MPPRSLTAHRLPSGRAVPVERATVALKLLCEMRLSAVRTSLMEQFGIKRDAANRAIEMARILLREETEANLPFMRDRIIARMERLIDRADNAGRTNAAIKGLMGLAKIVKVLDAEQTNIHIGDKYDVKMDDLSDEELAVLAKLDAPAETTH